MQGEDFRAPVALQFFEVPVLVGISVLKPPFPILVILHKNPFQKNVVSLRHSGDAFKPFFHPPGSPDLVSGAEASLHFYQVDDTDIARLFRQFRFPFFAHLFRPDLISLNDIDSSKMM